MDEGRWQTKPSDAFTNFPISCVITMRSVSAGIAAPSATPANGVDVMRNEDESVGGRLLRNRSRQNEAGSVTQRRGAATRRQR